jgi:hypothetical protein
VAKIPNSDDSKCWQRHGTTGTVIHCWWELKNGTITMENDFLQSCT